MIAAIKFLPREEFKIMLKELANINFRYNICKLNPNESERLYSKVANEISNKTIKTAKEVSLALKSIYVSDDSFEQAFSTVIISTKSKKELVKYILVKIENHLTNLDNQPEDANSTIEHILPENPGSEWEEFFPNNEQDEYVFKLGNYSLIETSINKKLGNKGFRDKKEMYKKSVYKLSNEYCIYEKFTPNELNLRQERMGKIAKGIWKSSYI